jgi:hypothetical protein
LNVGPVFFNSSATWMAPILDNLLKLLNAIIFAAAEAQAMDAGES